MPILHNFYLYTTSVLNFYLYMTSVITDKYNPLILLQIPRSTLASLLETSKWCYWLHLGYMLISRGEGKRPKTATQVKMTTRTRARMFHLWRVMMVNQMIWQYVTLLIIGVCAGYTLIFMFKGVLRTLSVFKFVSSRINAFTQKLKCFTSLYVA